MNLSRIPCKSNPMPIYTIPDTEPDYQNMPFSFECVEGTIGVKFPLCKGASIKTDEDWAGGNSHVSSMWYRKVDTNTKNVLTDWTDWKADHFKAVELSSGQELQLSATQNPAFFTNTWEGYNNNFKYDNSGKVIIKGNLSSIFPNLALSSKIYVGNLFYAGGTNNLVDASKVVVPYNLSGSQGGMGFNGNYKLTGAPLFLGTECNYKMYNYNYNSCSSLIHIEIGFLSANNWSFSNWLNGVASNGILIKPPNTKIPDTRNGDSIPSNWTVLNRVGGKLYYAQQGNGSNVPYEGTDPYEWYWKHHRS